MRSTGLPARPSMAHAGAVFGRLLSTVLLAGACLAAPCRAGQGSIAASARPALSARDVGEYGAVPWDTFGSPAAPGSRAERVRDLNLAVSSVNLQGHDIPQKFLDDWARLARWGREHGKKLLPRVYFWDGEDRYQGPMRDVEVYWGRLDRFLGAMALADFHGIVLAEENVCYAGRPEVLAELYRRIKAKYDVPVWQWWSPSTAVPGDGGWIPADGWVVDPYFKPRSEFRTYLRKYLITGLPVVVMPWAADGQAVSAEEWEANVAQLDTSVEFNLPVAFYWVSGPSCYFGGNRKAHEKPIDRLNHLVWDYIARVRALPEKYTGLPSADRADGQVLELGPVEEARFVYTDDFGTSQCVDHATMTSFRDLVLDGRSLAARGFLGRPANATLTYHWAGEVAVRSPEVSLDTETDPSLRGRVEIALSRDGRTWRHVSAATRGKQHMTAGSAGDGSFAAVNEFWVRVGLTGQAGSTQQPACRIDNLRVSAAVVPPREAAAPLRPSPGKPDRLVYEDSFDTRKYLLHTTRAGDGKLEWSPGQIAVRLRPGGSNVSLVWRVTSDRPVRDVALEVSGRANNGSLGTNHFLEVSADGREWLPMASSVGGKTDANGWVSEPLTADLAGKPAYGGIREFYVRLRMVAGSYEKMHWALSGEVTGLRITARPASQR